MPITVIEILVFAAVFAAVCLAYALGGARAAKSLPGLHPIRQYSPPVPAVLEYRNESGFTTLRRISILRSLHRPDGRLYLLAFSNKPAKPRTFRVDRILCVATLEGEVIDTQAFLSERLGIPDALCATQVRPPRPHATIAHETISRIGTSGT